MPHLLTVLGASHVLASGSVGASPQGSVWPWAGSGLTSRAVGEKGRPCLAGVPRTPLEALGCDRECWKGPRRLGGQDSALENEGVAWERQAARARPLLAAPIPSSA